MNLHPKIQNTHLNRQAVIYVRQSSIYQVQNNLESQKRQYALKDRAVKFGWQQDQILIIDEDLGISGAHSENRPGYQKLVSLLALRKIGIILGLEVSRLARNCLDWYQLLELASTFDTLISDEDTVFQPGDYNDRLLLGLRGTISEAELYQIRNRMMRGRMNKATRGELEITLPIGYERNALGHTCKSSDQAVRTTINHIFTLFRQIRSVRGVLMVLVRAKQELPYWKKVPGMGRSIAWHPPRYETIYAILTNSTYAGVFSYGKRKRHYDPSSKKYYFKSIKGEEIDIMISDHHEGYVTQEEHAENLRTIQNNRFTSQESQGASREGAALLQGIVYCKRCGQKMRPRYTSQRYYYCCDRDHRRFGVGICGWASAGRVDAVIEEHVLQVLNEGTVDLTFMVMENHRDTQAAAQKQWDQKLKRLEYEANLFRRRYEAVDPENRLVTSTLEKEWNEKLTAVATAKNTYKSLFSEEIREVLACEEVKKALEDFPKKWRANSLETREKKEILRCLVDRVFINTKGKTMLLEVIWQGGIMIQLQVPKYLFTCVTIFHRVQELAHKHTDAEIAAILNQEKILTVKRKIWTPRRVMDFRLSNHIPSGFTHSSSLKIAAGYVDSQEAARSLGVRIGAIQEWSKLGILKSRSRFAKQESLWVHLDDETKRRLDGTASFDKSVKSFSSLMRTTEMIKEEVIQWSKENGHEIIRLRRGVHCRFYVRPLPIRNATVDRSM